MSAFYSKLWENMTDTLVLFILICVDLDTVSLRVEGSGVVELQDDQGEGVSLRHLLVIVQRSNLREENIIQHQR